MTKIWVPGYDEVLEKFERYKQQDKNVERAKDRLMQICWKQTSYIRRDPIRAYQEAPALQRYVELREERNEELIRQIEKIKDLQKEIMEMLDLLDDPYRTILHMYYVLDYSWVKVSMEVNYNFYYCLELRDKAICALIKASQTKPN